MWKRWISCLIMFLSIGFFIKTGNAAMPTVSIPNVEVSRNASYIQIPINIDNAEGVAGFQFTVTFDQTVLQPIGAVAGTLTNGWAITPNPNVPGEIQIGGYEPTLTGLGAVSGSLCLMNFNVLGNPGSTTNLTLEYVLISDSSSVGIDRILSNGSFKIEGYSISGKVTLVGGVGVVSNTVITLGGSPLEAQGLSKNGIITRTTSPDSLGNYSFSDLPGEHTYGILPELTGYSFSPMSRDYEFGGRQPAGKQNYDDITDADFTGEELKEPATFEVINNDGYGNPSPAVGTHNYFIGDSITTSVSSPVAGVDGERFVCIGWEGTGSVPATGTESSVTFTIDEDSSIAWFWKKEYRLTTIIEGNGTITQNPLLNGTTSKSISTDTWYDDGTTVQLTAIADEGWIFSHWIEYMGVLSKSGAPADNIKDVTMDGPQEIKAVFLKEEPVLSITPTELEFVLVDENSKNEEVTISNTGAVGDLEWQVGEIIYQQGEGWLQVAPTEGTLIPEEIAPASKSAGNNSCIITITATKGELTGGTYNATIPITSNGGNQNILVTMVIVQRPETIAPPVEEGMVEAFPFVPFTSQFFRSGTGGTVNCNFEIVEIECDPYGKGCNDRIIYHLENVIRTLDNQNIVTLTAPWGLFKPDTNYRWRVSDNDMGEYTREEEPNDKSAPVTNPLWSEWSEVFTVERDVPEVGEESNDFLNSFSGAELNLRTDGAHAFKNPETGEFLMATNPECSEGTATKIVVELLNPENVEGTAALGINYMFDVRIELDVPGATATFDLLIPGDFNGGVWKYNPDTNELLAFDGAEIIGTVVNNDGNKYTVVAITLQDGGKWDFDGEANGVIADPIGLGVFSGFDKVSGGGGCFIATAAFGSPFERHVQILRQFRDRYLLTSTAGRAFVRWYYRHSPKYASIISQNEALKVAVRISLLPLYGIAYILVKGLLPYVLFGLGLLLLLGLRKRSRKTIITLLMVGLFLGVITNGFAAETNHFKVAPAEEATVIVPTTKTIGSQKVAVDFFYSFAKNPLEGKTGGKDVDLIKDQSLLNAGITMGLTENSQISLVIPYVFNQGAASPIEKDGCGDMLLSGKIRLPNNLMEGKVAIAPYIQFTTGNEDAGLGSENAAFGIKGIYDTKLNENTLFTLNLGFAYQSKEKLAQVPINHSILFGAGLVYNLPGNSSYISTELYGRSEELFEKASSPVELLVSYGRNCQNFTFTVGGGFAVVDGYGASDWRLFSGLRMGL